MTPLEEVKACLDALEYARSKMTVAVSFPSTSLQVARDYFLAWFVEQGMPRHGRRLMKRVVIAKHRQTPYPKLALAMDWQFDGLDDPTGEWEVVAS